MPAGAHWKVDRRKASTIIQLFHDTPRISSRIFFSRGAAGSALDAAPEPVAVGARHEALKVEEQARAAAQLAHHAVDQRQRVPVLRAARGAAWSWREDRCSMNFWPPACIRQV